MKILIVDDNADYGVLLSEVFRDRGWETVTASDGEECMRLLEQGVPDVILSDVMMPRMDGFQLLRALRGSRFGDLTFIFYTVTYEKPEHREFAMSLGADGYIVKPADVEDIVTAMEAVLEGKHAAMGHQPMLTEEDFLRRHNILLSEKLLEKALELQRESAEHRRDEEELASLRKMAKHHAAPSVPLAPVQCPFSVSDAIYEPIARIDEICEEMTARRAELADAGAATLVEQLCSSMRRLRQHVNDLKNFIIIPRSELYAPMRRIQMLIEVLKKDYPNAAAWVFMHISTVESHLRHFASLVDDLVKLTTVAKVELIRQPVDLTLLARSLAEDLRKTAPGRRAEFLIQEGMELRADRKLIRLALEHLLDNAWKFSRERDPARIEFDFITMDQKRVYVVRDNGVGFPPEQSERIFTAFQKLHPADRYPGHGIGLAIVKTVICRHGGAVWATGEPDHGASVYFTIASDA